MSKQQSQALGITVFYLCAAITMVTVNKWVLISSPVPVFFLFCQLAMSVLLLLVCDLAGILPLPKPKLDLELSRQLAPLVGINVMGLTFNNLCLQYVDASFYQVARGLVLPITVVLSIAMKQGTPSALCQRCVMIITVGFFVGVFLDDPSMSKARNAGIVGIIFGVISSFSTAVHAIVIKKSFAVVDGSAATLAWYSNFLSTVAIAPLIVIMGEVPEIVKLSAEPLALRTFGIGVGLTGVFGFLISVAGLLSIKVTSPVTHMVSSATRGVLQTLISIWAFGDRVSRARLASIMIILVGSTAYVWAKFEESNAAPKKPAVPADGAAQVPLLSTANGSASGGNDKAEIGMETVGLVRHSMENGVPRGKTHGRTPSSGV